MVSDGLNCVLPKDPDPQPPPKPPPPPFSTVSTLAIEFIKDAPQTWFDPRSSLAASLTGDGKTHFGQLVSTMKGMPNALVQIEGHASSDRPASDADYNQRLTDRRVKLIEAELKKAGVDTDTRLSDPPGTTPSTGCIPLKVGELSCGDTGSATPVDPLNRNVTARVFTLPPP
jgi:hypothetical protein